MAVSMPVFRVLSFSSLILLTTVLFVLQVDGKIDCSYFGIFVPVWVYGGVLTLVLFSSIVTHCRSICHRCIDRRYIYRHEQTLIRKLWFILLLGLIFTFVLFLTLRLDMPLDAKGTSWYTVIFPLWILVFLVLTDTTRFLWKELNR